MVKVAQVVQNLFKIAQYFLIFLNNLCNLCTILAILAIWSILSILPILGILAILSILSILATLATLSTLSILAILAILTILTKSTILSACVEYWHETHNIVQIPRLCTRPHVCTCDVIGSLYSETNSMQQTNKQTKMCL